MTREVTLLLVDGTALAPFEVDYPWWQEVRGVVSGARKHFGLDLSVLRILSTEPGLTNGGRVTYLAEPVGWAGPVHDTDHPLRPDYAKPGGPSRTLAWAQQVLDCPITNVHQQRTWNLSAIWKLETERGLVWLKQVPRFFLHEASVIGYLGQPPLIAADDQGRMLLADVPGEDLYGAQFEVHRDIAEDMVRIQLRALQTGPPRGLPPMLALAPQPWLAERLERVAAAGMPDTLVHGDLHPGNVRGTPAQRTIIDWGDSFWGQPGFDILRLTERLSKEDALVLVRHWAELWREALPGCDPEAAVEALRPVAALRNAAVYANFLAHIEPSEHPYHAGDVPFWLAEAQRIAGGE
ncbi:hypothetical protein Rhe02_79050 [Rhizocola hellebori]|uniref:Aminoglycoside phosphotransferase domain-containing protein n=1 Tax=Rhizocola hellebori TaxID=1392758 RepID=A0A8J3VL80_9ACTN|nr:phosphotransferase [Rhizocola hellebori]GIH09838.1 hypothetical protein Rhe02_79050 [Rhizocola hellebori]